MNRRSLFGALIGLVVAPLLPTKAKASPKHSDWGAHIQPVRVSINMSREQLFELGRRGPYHRYIEFPVK